MGKIIHIVLWRLKPTSSPEEEESVKAGIAELKTLAGPEVLHLSKPLVETRAQGYNYGLYSVFPSREALDTYAVSEAHVRVVEEKIKPFIVIPDTLAYDWELPA